MLYKWSCSFFCRVVVNTSLACYEKYGTIWFAMVGVDLVALYIAAWIDLIVSCPWNPIVLNLTRLLWLRHPYYGGSVNSLIVVADKTHLGLTKDSITTLVMVFGLTHCSPCCRLNCSHSYTQGGLGLFQKLSWRGTFFFRSLHPQDTHGMKSESPPTLGTPPPHYGSNTPWPPGQVNPPTPRTRQQNTLPHRTKMCLRPTPPPWG